jgi:hypothetical protein
MFAQVTDPLPPGWEGWGLVGFLFFAVIGLAAYIYYLHKSTISKAAYDDIVRRCEEMEKRCAACLHVNGETLHKVYEALGELSASGNLNVQALTAIRQTIDNALLRGGN